LATNDPADFMASIGMTQYITYFTTVIGVFELRLRPDSRESGSTLASYHTSNVTLVIFCSISLLIVGWSAVEHPMNIVADFCCFWRRSIHLSFDFLVEENRTGA